MTGMTTVYWEVGSKGWKDHLRQKVINHSVGVTGGGWIIRGYVGNKIQCPTCKAMRYDDGTRCSACGNYMWHKEPVSELRFAV